MHKNHTAWAWSVSIDSYRYLDFLRLEDYRPHIVSIDPGNRSTDWFSRGIEICEVEDNFSPFHVFFLSNWSLSTLTLEISSKPLIKKRESRCIGVYFLRLPSDDAEIAWSIILDAIVMVSIIMVTSSPTSWS